MIFSDVPGSTVSRSWAPISILYSNLFRFRGLSKDNQFRISLGVGFRGSDGIPVIVSQKTGFVFSNVWQQVEVPLREPFTDGQLYIYARISDVQWGSRGPVEFQLQEGDSMIYSQSAAIGNAAPKGPLVEKFGSVLDVKTEGSMGPYTFPSVVGRESGFIRSQYGAPVWIYFSANIDQTRPFGAKVPSGGAIEFPPNYEGPWSVDPGDEEVSDSPSISYVEYVRA
jgi:hypothetical protein